MRRLLCGMTAAFVTLSAGSAALAGPPAKGGNGGGGSPGGRVVSGSPGNYKLPGNFKPSGNWQPSVSKVSTPSHAPVKDYHLTYGKPFGTGYCYPGKYHDHWTYSCYWPKYGCYCYWCPYTCCYYYWYEPAGCYYPCSYVRNATPEKGSAPADVSPEVTPLDNAKGDTPNGPTPNGPTPPAPPADK